MTCLIRSVYDLLTSAYYSGTPNAGTTTGIHGGHPHGHKTGRNAPFSFVDALSGPIYYFEYDIC